MKKNVDNILLNIGIGLGRANNWNSSKLKGSFNSKTYY